MQQPRHSSLNSFSHFFAFSARSVLRLLNNDELDGTTLWTNKLFGFMNRDLWCANLNDDPEDEILAANADGSIYCLDDSGTQLWSFKANNAPMNAVCVIKHEGKTLVACGGYDCNIYYLSTKGKQLKTIPSSTYSKEKPWGKNKKKLPPAKRHVANFIRPIMIAGEEKLAVHGTHNSNTARGTL